MKRSSYAILAAALALAFVAATVLIHASARPPADPPFQQKERQAENSGPGKSLLNRATPITLSAAAQARVGIRTLALRTAAARRRISAAAVVLSAESLAAARNAYVVAQAKLQKAQVSLGVSQEEFARVKKLYEDKQNVSEKSFQAAQGAVRADRIDIHEARLQLNLQGEIVRQKWGPVVAKWVETASSALDGVLGQDEFLVQVSLPAGEFFSPAPTISLALPGSGQRRATFVSSLPQVDPRVQGTSLLYLTRAWMGLAPGVTLAAALPVGRRMQGTVVPASAVVWSEGKAWVYVQTSPEKFVRRPLGPEFPFDGGFFVSQGLVPGDKVVVTGAQTLLSEEISPKGSSRPEDEDDD